MQFTPLQKLAAFAFLIQNVQAAAVNIAETFEANANLTERRADIYGWAMFYDRYDCTRPSGRWVSMSNDGCLANEIGRGSINIRPQTGLDPHLVMSPGYNCDCQQQCIDINNSGDSNYCFDLSAYDTGNSYRFIQEGCGKNNC